MFRPEAIFRSPASHSILSKHGDTMINSVSLRTGTGVPEPVTFFEDSAFEVALEMKDRIDFTEAMVLRLST
jgi:hypothetical protein